MSVTQKRKKITHHPSITISLFLSIIFQRLGLNFTLVLPVLCLETLGGFPVLINKNSQGYDTLGRLPLWNPHGPCKYVYTIYREFCMSIEVFVYTDNMPCVTELKLYYGNMFLSLFASISVHAHVHMRKNSILIDDNDLDGEVLP